jgi:hypothetical protein
VTNPEIAVTEDSPGLRITELAKKAGITIHTSKLPTLERCSAKRFPFPVDTTVQFASDSLKLPHIQGVWVRNEQGGFIADSCDGEPVSVPLGSYCLKVSRANTTLYFVVDSSVTIEPHTDMVTIRFGGTTSIQLGVRTRHQEPIGTITTPSNMEDLFRAISLLGAALKTTSCERSFPTLRDHCPLIELGGTFDAPPGITSPETGIRIELPPDLDYLYPVTSLAYYLGAEVFPGTEPRLYAGDESYSLDGPQGFERTIQRVLRQVFFFDCLTRSEGHIPVELTNQSSVESMVGIEFNDLYGQSIVKQIQTYLNIPFSQIEQFLPKWKLTADVMPESRNIDTLPYLANELAFVRCPNQPPSESEDAEPSTFEEFYRQDPQENVGTGDSQEESKTSDTATTVFVPDDYETFEHTWIGNGFPFGTSKASTDSYRQRLSRNSNGNSRINVQIVCNDREMRDEQFVENLYGTHRPSTFDVSTKYNLTMAELSDIFQSSIDFLHFIGHVDDDGFQCRNGFLDAKTLNSVGVDAFFLNACQSNGQGTALVANGSIGGVVTLSMIGNQLAVDIGGLLARLLDTGFPLATALALIQNQYISGKQYMVVGDGNFELVPPEDGAPKLVEIESRSNGTYDVEIQLFPTATYPLGTLYTPQIGDTSDRYLRPASITRSRVSGEELATYLEENSFPVKIDDEFSWSDQLSVL